jgi:hypothetical protein
MNRRELLTAVLPMFVLATATKGWQGVEASFTDEPMAFSEALRALADYMKQHPKHKPTRIQLLPSRGRTPKGRELFWVRIS